MRIINLTTDLYAEILYDKSISDIFAVIKLDSYQ